ncbi:MAG: hypothetical protein A3J66_04165 [Candidatus Magasanikbacteria bacterium RIFCSPHIGHO2_02_FULL_47_14]|uniref:Disulfide bond formation protein B n=1 Tax=Candidatus Magasanikbacteria bacterium RIFCSPHIGHO2_02_FULL_47_14 TaxID=1798680 RepID=A0A1F6M3Q2_9BACT|nr:MAG: hypothetical protein A3J66_04165 [Candidatus Magasanikbacteria bacterium RIFCSPHIGHO2_02_FULL_47_14]
MSPEKLLKVGVVLAVVGMGMDIVFEMIYGMYAHPGCVCWKLDPVERIVSGVFIGLAVIGLLLMVIAIVVGLIGRFRSPKASAEE